MGITGLIPFIEKASRRTNVAEFSGCTVAIDTYSWLHKGAFACADKLVRGEATDIHIKYCLKYVTMLLSKNIKPILVFDGRHLPAKAMTELKRRESRDVSKKRAAELLSLGKIEEARSYMRRSVDITHAMALALIKECRSRRVDCIVAPYEADAQLAYLNINNIAHLVITEDSDLVLFGCTKVLFKMDLEGTGVLVETGKLPLVMRCPVERYRFDKFRRMCIMSGCDYLPSLPGIGLVKARQFVTATEDSNFGNALKRLPSFFNRMSLTVTDEYRQNFLRAEATFKHQYVYDPLQKRMLRLTEPEDEDTEIALCVNAGELLDPNTAYQLALGNLDPFTLKKMDDWDPDTCLVEQRSTKTDSWREPKSSHPSIWSENFKEYLNEPRPWQREVKKPASIIAKPQTRQRKVVNLVSKYVPETEDQSLSIETLSNMYCVERTTKRAKMSPDSPVDETLVHTQDKHNIALTETEILHDTTAEQNKKSPILQNKDRSFRKAVRNGQNIMKRFSKFPRTVMDDNIVESKFFNSSSSETVKNIRVEESPEKISRNPFKVKSPECKIIEDCEEMTDTPLENSQKENSPYNSPVKRPASPILKALTAKHPFALKCDDELLFDKSSDDSVIENTYPLENLATPVDSQLSFGESPPEQASVVIGRAKSSCRVPGLRRGPAGRAPRALPSNQPTLLSKFGFQKKPVLKR